MEKVEKELNRLSEKELKVILEADSNGYVSNRTTTTTRKIQRYVHMAASLMLVKCRMKLFSDPNQYQSLVHARNSHFVLLDAMHQQRDVFVVLCVKLKALQIWQIDHLS